LTYAQAVNEALAEEMRRDPTVCIFGEDVAEAGTPFKVLSGLVAEFGKGACHRYTHFRSWIYRRWRGCRNDWVRPVVDIMFGDSLR